MKKLLPLFALALSISGFGQSLPIPMNIRGYRGNPIPSDTIYLAPADTLPGRATVSARPAVGSGLTTPQPVLVHKGQRYVVYFATSETLPELSLYELKVGGVTRYAGTVTVNKQQLVQVPNIPATTLSYIYSRLDALTGQIGSLSAGTVTPVMFTSFTAATNNSLAQLASDIANRVLTSDYNTYKTNNALSISNINAALALKAPQSALDATNSNVVSLSTAVGANTSAIANAEPGVLRFNTYAQAVAGLVGRTKPCRVLILADEVNNGGSFGKYDYDGTNLIEDLL